MGELARQAKSFVTYQLTKPNSTQQAIRRLEERLVQGELQMQSQLVERDRSIKVLKLTLKTLVYGSLTGFSSLIGVLLLTNASYAGGAVAAFIIAAVSGVMLLKSLIHVLLQGRINRLIDQ